MTPPTMSPEAQRIAIAEACGWTSLRIVGEEPMGRPPMTADRYDPVPDYLADLNAIHQAWETLGDAQRFSFRSNLSRVVAADFASGKIDECWYEGATAAQRAEAFLRALNLWDESK